MLHAEKTRHHPVGFKTAIVFGDSRLGEGFSAKAANEFAEADRLEIVNAAIPSTTLRCWAYFVKRLDPDANRYDYVVLALPSLSTEATDVLADRLLDLDYLAPLVGLNEVFNVAATFSDFEVKMQALRDLMLKGFIFKYDVQDFLSRPLFRIRAAFQTQADGWYSYFYPGRQESLEGVTWDEARLEPVFSDGVDGRVKEAIQTYERNRKLPSLAVNSDYNKKWLNLILDHYKNSKTRVVVLQMPRGPLPTTSENVQPLPEIQEVARSHDHFDVVAPNRFRDFENPQDFFDYLHMNAAGRRRFSRALTDEILKIHRRSKEN